MHIEVTYSAHDGGWYAEVYDSTGRTLYETPICRSKLDAIEEARTWIRLLRVENIRLKEELAKVYRESSETIRNLLAKIDRLEGLPCPADGPAPGATPSGATGAVSP